MEISLSPNWPRSEGRRVIDVEINGGLPMGLHAWKNVFLPITWVPVYVLSAHGKDRLLTYHWYQPDDPDGIKTLVVCVPF